MDSLSSFTGALWLRCPLSWSTCSPIHWMQPCSRLVLSDSTKRCRCSFPHLILTCSHQKSEHSGTENLVPGRHQVKLVLSKWTMMTTPSVDTSQAHLLVWTGVTGVGTSTGPVWTQLLIGLHFINTKDIKDLISCRSYGQISLFKGKLWSIVNYQTVHNIYLTSLHVACTLYF